MQVREEEPNRQQSQTQLMAKLSLFLSYKDMFRPTTTAIVRLDMKPFLIHMP